MSERRRSHRSSGIYKAFAPSDVHYPSDVMPLQAPESLSRWTHLASGMDQLAAHMRQLAAIHSALADSFNESFASFLYGLLITMFCNNFPETPSRDQYEHKSIKGLSHRIDTLQDRVRMAKAKNQQLRAEVERRKAESRSFRDTARFGPGFDTRSGPRFDTRSGSRFDTRSDSSDRFDTPTRLRHNPLFQKPAHLRASVSTPRSRGQAVGPNDKHRSHVAGVHSAPSASASAPLARPRAPAKVAVAHDDTYSTSDSFMETPSADPNLNQPPRYMRGLFDKSGTANMRNTARVGKTRLENPRGSAAQRAQRARQSRMNTRPPFR